MLRFKLLKPLNKVIAISSYRPLADSEAIFKNQFDAKRTWENVFEEIVYFGYFEDLLSSKKTTFVPCGDKPTIKLMAELAAHGFGWRAIINADIQVDCKMHRLERILKVHGAMCAFSFRIPVGKTQREDLGIDFFAADTDVWKQVAAVIPEAFTIGRIQWDTWLASFFMAHWPGQCFDLSPSKLFLHPEHGERGDQTMEIEDPYLKNFSRWTAKPLKF